MARAARWAPWILAGFVFAARVPFLGPGYGIDPDAWRIAADGRAMAASHVYAAARAPGNPIVELAAALLWRGGPLAINGLTALFSAIAAAVFALTLRRLGVRDWVPGALALAFTPVIAVNSANAMDYLWALAFILIAHDLALRRRPLESGVMIGLATGCRPTSILIVPALAPLFVRTKAGRPPRWDVIVFVIAAGFVSLASFLPALVTYGTGFLHGYGHGYPPWLYVIKNATVDVWGIPGSIGLGIVLIAAIVRRAARRDASAPSPAGEQALPAVPRFLVGAWTMAVAFELASFIGLPHQAEYLIPTVPFVLLLAARFSPPRLFRVLCVLLIASSFVLKVSELGKPDSPSASSASWRLGSNRVLDLRGPLFIEHERRRKGVEYVERVIAHARSLPPGSVISAYEWRPFIAVMLGGTHEDGVEFDYVLDRAAIARHRAAGDSLYDLPGAEDESVVRNGIGLHALGSRPLEVGLAR